MQKKILRFYTPQELYDLAERSLESLPDKRSQDKLKAYMRNRNYLGIEETLFGKGVSAKREATPPPPPRAQSPIPKPPALEEYYAHQRTPSKRVASLKPGEKRSKEPSHIPMYGLENPMEESSVLQSLRTLFEQPKATYEDPEPGQRLSKVNPAVRIAEEAKRKKTETPARARSAMKTPMEERIIPSEIFEQAPIENQPKFLTRTKSPHHSFSVPKGLDPRKVKAVLDARQREIAKKVNERPNVDTTAMLNSVSQMRALPESTEVTHGPKYFQMGEKERYALNNQAVSNWKPFVPEEMPVAPPSELMTFARDQYKDQLNPFSEENIDYNNKLQDLLAEYAKDKTSQNAVKPYLERMIQDPRMMQEELAQDARDHIRSMQEEASQNLRENVFPKIHRQFQRPGLMSHGHHSKLRQKEIEKYNRGLQHAIAQTKGQYRNQAIGHALSHAKLLGEAAHTQEKSAVGDRDNELRAVQAMEKARENEFTRGGRFIEGLERMGLQDQQHAQKNLTFQTDQQQRIVEHPLAQAHKLAELNRDFHADTLKSVTGRHEPEPVKSALGNAWNAGGQGVAKIAGNMMGMNQTGFKKGGRIRKAIGGQVNPMQDVIQNAVIDKIDPVTELRRMIQHSQGLQGLQGRQQLKIGGSVDPIKAGAEDAKMYAGHDAMKHLLRRQRDPSLMNAIGHGLDVAPTNTGGIADVMRAFSSGYKGAQGRLSEADELEYKLQQQLEAKAEREREMAQKDRDLSRQDQLAASTIEHHRMMNQKLGHEMGSGFAPEAMEDRPRGKQTKGEEESVANAKERARATADLLQNIDRIEALLEGVKEDKEAGIPGVEGLDTGYWLDKKHTFGPALAGDDPDKYQELQNAYDEHIQLAKALQDLKGKSSRATNLTTNLMVASKISKKLTKEAQKKHFQKIRENAERDLKGIAQDIRGFKGSVNSEKYPLQFIPKVKESKKQPSPSTHSAAQDPRQLEMKKQELLKQRQQLMAS